MRPILMLVFLCFSLSCSAQQLPEELSPEKGTAQWYLQKSRSQKTAAWLLIGVGTALTIAGMDQAVMISFTRLTEEEKRKQRAGTRLAVIGSMAMLSSTPLFIAGARNKRQGKLLLKNETSFVPDVHLRQSYPALSFTVPL